MRVPRRREGGVRRVGVNKQGVRTAAASVARPSFYKAHVRRKRCGSNGRGGVDVVTGCEKRIKYPMYY